MSDRVCLAGMVFAGRHGVHEWEQREAQPFEVDVELLVDTRAAAEGDDLARTVDYGRVFGACRQIVETESHRLIETVAARIAAEILAGFELVEEVVVRVRKPAVQLPGTLAYAGVEIRRRRESSGP